MEYYLKNDSTERTIAYFSLEIGIKPEIPSYSGGLGILAGDTIKSFADLNIPAVAVTLLYDKGYFHQELDAEGNQQEIPVNWEKEKFMRPLPNKVIIRLEGRDITIQGWVYEVIGVKGGVVPVLFLDADLEVNEPNDRQLTSYLYGGDRRYRLLQEAILGIGGPRMLQSVGHNQIEKFHMNEGHAALLTLELMNRFRDLNEVRENCVFTTHTPVPAGHDTFELDLARSVLRDFVNVDELNHDNIIDHEGKMNMTYLALHHANYVNGVAKKHGEVSRKMFPGYSIEAITNGVHAGTWVCESMAKLFDKFVSGWRNDQYSLRNALNMPSGEVWKAHIEAKKDLIGYIKHRTGVEMNKETLTIGFARRAATYKRPDLIFRDMEKLKQIVKEVGKIQIVFAGKAHPADGGGKDLIKRIHQDIKELKDDIKIVYLSNYEMYLGKLLTSGVDIWLNTPLRPREASGTSGMKAALNGVLNFSVLDGWWLEGHVEDQTGWSIGPRPDDVEDEVDESADIKDLYEKLETKIIPAYYKDPEKWKRMMKYSIAFNGAFFNTQRMVSQYVMNAYFKSTK